MSNNILNILTQISGVEVIPIPESGQLENSRSFDSEFWSTEHYPRNASAPSLKFSSFRHPVSFVFTSEAEGSEFESALEKAIDELRSYLIGSIENYAPLYLPLAGYGADSYQITVDGYPVRVVMTYDGRNQGFITSFDTQRLVK